MPLRTCVVCRKTSEGKELLRFVGCHCGNELFLDLSGAALGRGAYCHIDMGCMFGRDAWARIVSAVYREKDVKCKSRGQAGFQLMLGLLRGVVLSETDNQRLHKLVVAEKFARLKSILNEVDKRAGEKITERRYGKREAKVFL